MRTAGPPLQGADGGRPTQRCPAPYFVGLAVTMPMAEVFKIVNGNIREVEAVGVQIPYGLGPGWE